MGVIASLLTLLLGPGKDTSRRVLRPRPEEGGPLEIRAPPEQGGVTEGDWHDA